MTRIALFSLLCLCLVGLATRPVTASTPQAWRFKVFLDDQEIGQHTFEIIDRDNTRYVDVEARFDVKFLFFTAYYYQHSNHEVWQGNCLNSIQSNTDDNGETQFVQGKTNGDVFQLRTPQGENRVDGCIKTFAYWDPSILNSDYLLNAQTGELMPVSIDDLGIQSINVTGKPVAAQHYRINTDQFSIDLWYSPQREWLALQSATRDGAVLRYQRQ